MKKFLVIIFFSLFFSNYSHTNVVDELNKLNYLFKAGVISKEEFIKGKSIILGTKKTEEKIINVDLDSKDKNEIEIKNGVFIEDVEAFGAFYQINIAPKGMFKARHSQFIQMSKYSQEKIGMIFITQKGMMDKYPENLMLGMGYFEFFYMQQLKENKKEIDLFKENYPNIKNSTRKAVQKIHSLNKARKAMRSALGFTLEDDVQKVIKNHYVLSKLFSRGEKITVKLDPKEKKLLKNHLSLSKNVGALKNLVKDKNEKRIEDKKFEKKYLKINKKIKSNIKKLNEYDNYNQLNKLFHLIDKIKISESDTLLSAYNLADFLLTEIKNNDVKTKYKVDLSNIDFKKFTQDELEILGIASKNTKLIKADKSNKIQLDIFNLENNNIPINKILDGFRKGSLKLDSINLQMTSEDKMKRWVKKDWANAWRTPIPEKIDDTSKGIMIDLSEEDVESIKAQLSIDLYNDLLNSYIAKDIQNTIDTSNFSFSYGLDDYAQFLGDLMNLDIKNYADLTALANATYNANWSVEEYASAYQLEVDAINALGSGVSSFDVATMASSVGATLQEAANVIAAASAAGISVDLEAAAAGAGFGSFAEAVAAYNAAHGTTYTEAQAKEALGQ
jgi:hypothetical protein